MVCALWLVCGVALTMRLVPTGHLLFFASPKKSKQKKGDPDVQVWLRQTSRRLHSFFGACELAALRASSDKRTLFSEKRMLRSAGRRGRAVASNSCEALGSLKANLSSKKTVWHNAKRFCFFRLPIGFRQPENISTAYQCSAFTSAIRVFSVQ